MFMIGKKRLGARRVKMLDRDLFWGLRSVKQNHRGRQTATFEYEILAMYNMGTAAEAVILVS